MKHFQFIFFLFQSKSHISSKLNFPGTGLVLCTVATKAVKMCWTFSQFISSRIKFGHKDGGWSTGYCFQRLLHTTRLGKTHLNSLYVPIFCSLQLPTPFSSPLYQQETLIFITPTVWPLCCPPPPCAIVVFIFLFLFVELLSFQPLHRHSCSFHSGDASKHTPLAVLTSCLRFRYLLIKHFQEIFMLTSQVWINIIIIIFILISVTKFVPSGRER